MKPKTKQLNFVKYSSILPDSIFEQYKSNCMYIYQISANTKLTLLHFVRRSKWNQNINNDAFQNITEL